jgi:hypothetical protein
MLVHSHAAVSNKKNPFYMSVLPAMGLPHSVIALQPSAIRT